ncbi:MAG TPA: hypothetical protein VIW64_04385 [Pyrinomonadaceae bacterium]|jgi:hypothetical protein
MTLERLHSGFLIIPIIILLVAAGVPALNAQDRPQHPVAPPPLRIIPRAERTQLNEARDDKARVKLTIELAETHLANAELKTSDQQYDSAEAEAGIYWALLDDVLSFMRKVDRDSNRKRDLYKRLELALRAHGIRLYAMRRTTPAEYAYWLKEIEDFARSSRTEALNSFYGHTVIRDGPQKPAEAKDIKPLQQ